MGDNNLDTRDEAIRLITARMPQRLALMGDEVSWAFGLKNLPRGHQPPIWVRRVIYVLFEIPHARARPLTKPTRADLAKMMGYLSGLVTGGRILFEHPLDTSGVPEDTRAAMGNFQRRVGDVARPQLEVAGGFLAQISNKLPNTTPETARAFHAAKSEMVDAVLSDEEKADVSEEVCFILWTFWPEVKTAASVRELHEWIEWVGFVHCGTKNFEKICRKIGFRGSARGRRKKR